MKKIAILLVVFIVPMLAKAWMHPTSANEDSLSHVQKRNLIFTPRYYTNFAQFPECFLTFLELLDSSGVLVLVFLLTCLEI